MSTAPPLVTALLPAYNAEKFIGRTLDSLAAQTWPNLEILLADDRSTDGTLALLEAFAAGRDNVRILPRPKNLGWLANSNDLMANARGEFMFFALHDDTVAPDFIERLMGALAAHPEAVLAYSDLELIQVDGQRSEERFPGLSGATTPLGRGLIMGRSPDNWWLPGTGVFRAAAAAAVGGMKRHAAGEFSADWPWLLHMALLGDFVRVPELLVRKHFLKTGVSHSWARSNQQRRALRQAGAREAWRSGLDLGTRAVLASYIALNLTQLRRQWRRLRR